MKGKKMLALFLSMLLLGGFFTMDGRLAQAAEKRETSAPFSGVIWIAGDSIASDHSDNANNGDPRPLVGWGEVIGDYLDARVHNEARSGRSSKSYVNENNNYKTIMKEIKAGDIFFIQFGHNDENSSAKLHTDPDGTSAEEGSYKWYLAEKYINPALEAGAYPVLCTSVARYLVKGGVLEEQSHASYVKAMKELAAEYEEKGIQIPVIDCHEYTKQLYTSDIEEGASYHALVKDSAGSGEKLDTTHYCEKGARNLALYIIESCRAMMTEMNFSEGTLTMCVGQRKAMPALICDSVYFLPLKVDSGIWESSNPDVVSVDGTKKRLTGILAGDTVISYKIGDIQAELTVHVEEKPVLKKGDADGNGEVTTDDALAVLKEVAGAGQESFWPEEADCDGAAGLSTDDALAILKNVAGLLEFNK